MNKPAVEIRNLSFSYGQATVLQDIDLCIRAEEFFGIIGPNAGGKSTLLKLMLGALHADTGTVSIFGQTPVRARAKIGYVPQFPSFRRDFPISVRDVVLSGRLGAAPGIGAYSAGDRALADAALESLELEHVAARQIAGLSGGQVQRMLIARALASEPELLILDEPTANIDIRAEEDIFALLKKYHERMTIIVVSHDISFISAYVNRVGCLNRTLVCHETGAISGRTIEELYGAPVRMIDHGHAH